MKFVIRALLPVYYCIIIVEIQMRRVQTDDEYQVTTLSIYLCLHYVTYLPTIYNTIDLISYIAQACMRSLFQ